MSWGAGRELPQGLCNWRPVCRLSLQLRLLGPSLTKQGPSRWCRGLNCLKSRIFFFLLHNLAVCRSGEWRRQWRPTPVLLPGKSRGWRSRVGCSPWGHEESDTTGRLHFHFSLSCIGEGNGNPLQCSCLESPIDSRAWWTAVYGVAQSRTRLKRLSSSSSSSSGEGVQPCFPQPDRCYSGLKEARAGRGTSESRNCLKETADTKGPYSNPLNFFKRTDDFSVESLSLKNVGKNVTQLRFGCLSFKSKKLT